jgi:hypothetical protein
MALRPEPTPADGPAWPVPTLTPGSQVGAAGDWPVVDLTEAQGQGGVIVPGQSGPERPARPESTGPGPAGPGATGPGPTGPGAEPAGRTEATSAAALRAGPSSGPSATAHSGPLATLQAHSLGELVSGAIAAGFVFLLAANVATAFASVPGEGVRARLLVAFNYANFLTAVALLLGMVCLLLLGRSATRGGLAHTSTGSPLKRPVKDVLAAVLAAEAALVGLGGLVSFVVYASLASSLPAAGAGHMLAELAILPVVAVTLLWGWAGGAAKLRVLFGVGSPRAVADQSGVTGPPGPPPSPGAEAPHDQS